MAVYYAYDNSAFLSHHGTKGMHWGVRRYQNPDGTLTPEGKKRYRGGGNSYYESVDKSYGQAMRGSTRYYKRKDDLFGREARKRRDSGKYKANQILEDVTNDDLRSRLENNAAGARREAADLNARPKAYSRYSTSFDNDGRPLDQPSERKIKKWIRNEFVDSSIEIINGYEGKALRDAGKAYVYQTMKDMEQEYHRAQAEKRVARQKEYEYQAKRIKKYVDRAKEVVTKPFKRNNQNEKE